MSTHVVPGRSHGLEDLLRAFGRSFADHASYANLLLTRQPDPAAQQFIRSAIIDLTARARADGVIATSVTTDDVIALLSAMRGLVQATDGANPPDWQRFLDLHLAGLRAATQAGVSAAN